MAVATPVNDASDLVEALNRQILRDKGTTRYGQQVVWTDYDGNDLNPLTGATLSANNHTLLIRNQAGKHIRVRNAAFAADVFTVEDTAVTVAVALGSLSLAVTNNATVGGTLGVTGAITGSSTVQGTRLISTIGTGTAPLTVSSTTKVTGLNADLLDDRDTGTGVGNIAFYNGSIRVVDSELVGGKSPGTGAGNIAFYDGSGRVADSQLLDGVDGSGYSLVAHTHAYLSTSGGTITGSLEVTNDITVTSTLTVNGNVNLGNATADTVAINGTVTWADQSGSGMAFASPSSGYLKVTIGGTQFRVPYFT